MPQSYASLQVCHVLTALGLDADAVHDYDRASHVFDLGLGCKPFAQFNTHDPDAASAESICAHQRAHSAHLARKMADRLR